jgi:hypothetical protein
VSLTRGPPAGPAVRAMRRMAFRQLPPTLVVHLKRFEYDHILNQRCGAQFPFSFLIFFIPEPEVRSIVSFFIPDFFFIPEPEVRNWADTAENARSGCPIASNRQCDISQFGCQRTFKKTKAI